MGTLVSLVFLLAMVAVSDAAWCVCRSDVSPTAQQKSIDYACGAGADCGPISQSGVCYNPNTVLAHCSYAVNSYFQRKQQAQGACDFSSTATLTTTDPSANGCTYPATPSAAGTGTSTPTPGTATPTPPGSTTTPTPPGGTTTPTSPGSTTTPTTNPGTTTPTTYPGSTTPNTFTPTGSGGVLGGGLGPSGNGYTDSSAAGTLLPKENLSLVLIIFISCMILVRG